MEHKVGPLGRSSGVSLPEVLHGQERHFRLLVRSVSDCAIYMLDVDGIVSNWNTGAQRTKGYLADEIVGRHFSCFYTQEDRSAGLPNRGLSIARISGKFESEGWRLRKDGSRFWAHVVIDAIRDDDGVLCGFAKVTRDRTEQRAAAESVESARRNLDLALSHIQQGVCLIDPAGRVVLRNAQFPALLNLAGQAVPEGGRVLRLLRGLCNGTNGDIPEPVVVATDNGPNDVATLSSVVSTHGGSALASRRRLRLMQQQLLAAALRPAMSDAQRSDADRSPVAPTPDGAVALSVSTSLEWRYGERQLAVSLRNMPAARAGGEADQAHEAHEAHDGGWLCTIEDVTAQRAAQRHISYLAHHDPLTGLPNRTRFYAHMQALAGPSALTLAADRNAVVPRFSLLYLDLDHFKPVNDSYGHHVGDCLLKAVAERLRALLGENDVLTRLGGDEFAIIQAPRFGASPDANEAHTTALAQGCLEALTTPFVIGGDRLQVGVSIGIVISEQLHGQRAVAPGMAQPSTTPAPRFASDGNAALAFDDPDTLLRCADIALYQAKRGGRNGFRIYQPGMQDPVEIRRDLERHLQRAVSEGHFKLFYQPLVDAVTGRLNACEALLRWEGYPYGAITPSEFIPVAEEIGLMQTLGSWVLEQACADAMHWPDDIRVCVNVSPVQLQDDGFADFVGQVLSRTGLPAERLEIELTESAVIAHTAKAAAILSAVRALGVGVVMDDFGTGYSALSLLQTLPFSRIKIDQLFVRSLGEDTKATAIVRAVTRLCAELGILAVGEGVETDTQRRLLAVEGCTELQGFLFSEPVALPILNAMLGIEVDGAQNVRRAWPGADPRLAPVTAVPPVAPVVITAVAP